MSATNSRSSWRTTLIVIGLPGLVLAALAHFVLDEPRLEEGSHVVKPTGTAAQTLIAALLELKAKRSFVYILCAAALYGLVAYGSTIFTPSFMVRSLGVNLADVSTSYGLITATISLTALLMGGRVADVLARRNVRWYAWLPAAGCALAFPLLVLSLMAESYLSFLVWGGIGGFFLSLGLSSMYALLHAVCEASLNISPIIQD